MHSLPPIEPIQIQDPKSTPLKQIPARDQTKEDQEECIFFKLPCTAKSQSNKETLKNEQSALNEAQIELPENKNLVLKTLLPNQISFNTSTEKNHNLKGIRLSMGSKIRPTQQTKIDQTEKQPQTNVIRPTQANGVTVITISPPEQSQNRGIQQFASKDKIYHQLNPLSIDRNKYDMRDLKLGGNKDTLQSRVSFGPSQRMSQAKNPALKNIGSKIRPYVVFNTSNTLPTFPAPSSPYNFNYQQEFSCRDKKSYCQTMHVQRSHNPNAKTKPNYVHESLPHSMSVRYELRSIPIYKCKTQHYDHDSGCTKHNESTHYQAHNTTLNEYSYFEQTQQFFNNIHIPKPQADPLQNSTYSHYSQKYRTYMEKQLVMPGHLRGGIQGNQMIDLMENVRAEVDSVNQEHNQKSQIPLNPHEIPLNPNQTSLNPNCTYHPPIDSLSQQRSQRKGSYSSSFMVVESKQKQIQSTRKIYLPSNIDTCSIPESGLIHQLDQFMIQDAHSHHNPNSESYPVSISQMSSLNQVQHDIETLSQTFHNLQAEEQSLHQQNQELCSLKIHELEQEMKALETLKVISEERRQEIDFLKQLLKVKLIQNKFARTPSLKDKYLKDERGWERYIAYNGESRCLNESNETTCTRN